MHFLADILNKLPEYRALETAVQSFRLPVCATGLSNVHKAHVVYSLCARLNRRALLIAPDEQEASRLYEDLSTFFGGGVYFYPARDFTLRPVEGVSREYEHDRLKVLGKMAAGDYHAVVACADGAMQLTMPVEEYKSQSIELRTGTDLPPEKAVEALVKAGYERAPQVNGAGQFSLRGGILDFFPPDAENPVRVEYWGDAPDSISTFDAQTQRRDETLESVRITPAVEVHFPSSDKMEKAVTGLVKGLDGERAASFRNDLEGLRNGVYPAGADRYLPLCYPKPGSLFDYARGCVLFVSEFVRVKDRAKNTLWQHGEDVTSLLEDGVLVHGLDRFYLDWPQVTAYLEKLGTVFLDTFARASYDVPVMNGFRFETRQLAVWGGGFKLLCEDLHAAVAGGSGAAVAAGTEKNSETIARELAAEGFSVVAGASEDAAPPAPGSVLVIPGRLSAGFEYPAAHFTLITCGAGSTGGLVRMKSRKRRHKAGERIRSLAELTPGDYVVHSAHGIGIYEGIQKLEVQGVVKDYIKIRYAGKDVLYVPVTQLDLVSKYIGARDDGAVRLNKMGGAEWQKTKSRVRGAVRDMAKELIALYAARRKINGITFPEDDDIQRDFEERFEYVETDDQLRCAEEIKADMQKPYPMDRLLCGDVGFGKTEVALRAAFKCILSGRQCALLVPTTLLAWQHYQTITKRMENFPIKIELLSRFRTSKQQEDILRRLSRGRIDVIIGTHRLVQKDVHFKNLGLLIVDEEQRFGVAQKEKLKEMFKDVDVLTLSATPIPRTMNMALSGIRDMSVIEEAPQDRHPVQTYVLEQDWGVVADAIRKELRRGGQVYYLHNRVETIESAASKILSLVPEARVGIAHGKMNEDELSGIWEKLLNNEIDVLVCTTIIETGVDVPNCNTLIIENADHMGLSQLHQIRGRVGRSSRHAFAYFMFKRGKVLSDIATKRLSAIREYTQFGAGFQIALRDLEIRGAGNILGSQQHGHMEAVGYDMYLKLLNDAVLEEKGEKPAKEEECMVDIQVTAHIPEQYIEDAGQRLEIYRRIADIRDEEDASDVIDELIDRFGDLPEAVKSLVDIALLRNTAAALGIREISQRDNVLLLYAGHFDFKAVSGLVSRLGGRVMVNAGAKPYVSVKIKDSQSPVDTLREVFESLKSEKVRKR